ncbi:hypothetical protein BDV96DRAFT_563152 [Lophiotrema nucula]|uniref:Uncharacterized protein n=1 Tax=Lophiotrema nucula TaxID=690887 RepID=A0A6A5ZTC4_9PLEO|nr:hypothetical protein BDV96DRAFT_563152 [Lophiotrema nucula]
MAVCKFPVRSDFYGLGIRIGFYFLWFGTILAAWIAPSEIRSLRLFIDLFVAATFLALIVTTINDVNNLQPVETYIVLLLAFGAYLALIPIYILRLLTCCDPYWNPSRWPLVSQSPLQANLSFIMLLGLLVYQYWFIFDRIPDLDRVNCDEYGFFFGQLKLNSRTFIVLNALFFFFLGLVALYILILKVRFMLGFPDPNETGPKRQISRRHKAAHIALLRNLDIWAKFIVAIAVTVAVEATISWNEIKGVSSLASVGQAIPFVIGLVAVLRILYVYFYVRDDDYDSDSEYSYRTWHGQQRHDRAPPPDLPPMGSGAPH